MSSVVFARSAQTDLLEVWSFIAEDSFEAADHVLDIIDREAQTLALQPLMGRKRSDLSVGIRSWPTSTSYNLYYLPSEDGIVVVRVLHHARDIQSREFMNQCLASAGYAGRSLYEVQKILGHTQIKTTQRYAHLSQDTLIDAANAAPFVLTAPMVAMVKAGSSGLMLGL